MKNRRFMNKTKRVSYFNDIEMADTKGKKLIFQYFPRKIIKNH